MVLHITISSNRHCVGVCSHWLGGRPQIRQLSRPGLPKNFSDPLPALFCPSSPMLPMSVAALLGSVLLPLLPFEGAPKKLRTPD